jgi:hypothetical protein
MKAKSTRRISVEEQDRIEGQDDVEAHRPHHKPQASDTPKDEGDEGDFELHRPHHKPMAAAASDTPKDEGDEGDFELHRKGHKAL